MKGPKYGLAVTLTICLLIVVFRQQIPSLVGMTVNLLEGRPQRCPFLLALSSSSQSERHYSRRQELKRQAKLIAHDRSMNLELYSIGSQQLWIPSGELENAAGQLTEQEHGIYETDLAAVRSGDTVLDVGAHIGIFARHALGLGAVRVVAVEPEPIVLECLQRNLKNEIQAGKVIICPKGAWDHAGLLDMNVSSGLLNASSFVIKPSPESQTIRLPVTTIDAMIEELELSRVDFIKMDIEGAERQALAGAERSIKAFHPRMAISVYHLIDDPVAIPAVIRAIRPDYGQKCKSCQVEGGIRPQVYFYF